MHHSPPRLQPHTNWRHTPPARPGPLPLLHSRPWSLSALPPAFLCETLNFSPTPSPAHTPTPPPIFLRFECSEMLLKLKVKEKEATKNIPRGRPAP